MSDAVNRATPKQIAYALSLMGERGWSTEYMNARHSQLGASMRQRTGTVEDWLSSVSVAECSRIITQLLNTPKNER